MSVSDRRSMQVRRLRAWAEFQATTREAWIYSAIIIGAFILVFGLAIFL